MKGGLGTPDAQADLDRLVRLADHPLVHVKLSAFYALGAEEAPI